MGTTLEGASPGWEAYGLVFVAIGVAFFVPLALHLLGRLFKLWPRVDVAAEETPPRPAEIPPDSTINTRYFTAAQMAGIVGLPLFMLVPLFGAGAQVSGWVILSVGICGGAALVYANRKGDLRWNDTLPQETGPDSSGSTEVNS